MTSGVSQSGTDQMLRIGFISLGCAKNRVDSQVMAGCLLNAGMTVAPPDQADVLLINTCAFIQDARDESSSHIIEACRMKQKGQCQAVIVAGCLPQRNQKQIVEAFPDVDAFIGLDELDDVASVIERVLSGDKKICSVSKKSRRLFDYGDSGVVFSSGPYAYVKLAEGCNHKCAFCAIPAIRGDRRSRPIEEIVRESEGLLQRGFTELNLIAQDITAYGRDTADKSLLPDLLRELGKIGGSFWIRLLYAYPTGITTELLETMAATQQVCNYLDVPVQHSHPDVLRAMHRAETIRAVAALPEKIRAIIPDATLRTTCLVGHPGETKPRFQHMLEYLENARFDHVGAFVFSPEKDTAAARMQPRPRKSTAEKRCAELLQQQYERVITAGTARIGKREEVLLEAPLESGIWRGRSKRLAPEVDGTVLVKKVNSRAKPGNITKVRYTAAVDYDMEAVVCR